MKHCFPTEVIKKAFANQIKKNLRNEVLSNPETKISMSDKVWESAKKFSKITLTQEVYTALQLVGFYFGPSIETKICFDMKTGFTPQDFDENGLSFEDLENWIDTKTAADFYLLGNSREFKFQIKTYPEKYGKKLSRKALVEYIKELSKITYGDMRDVILVIIVQVKKAGASLPVNLKLLRKGLRKHKVGFEDVVFLLNIEGGLKLFKALNTS